MFSDEEDLIVEMLAQVYAIIPWHKINTSKNAYDIFNHRVRAASRRATLYEAISKLANYFGLQSLPPDVIRIADLLREDEKRVLNKIYLEHIPICMKAILRAKEIKKEKREGEQ